MAACRSPRTSPRRSGHGSTRASCHRATACRRCARRRRRSTYRRPSPARPTRCWRARAGSSPASVAARTSPAPTRATARWSTSGRDAGRRRRRRLSSSRSGSQRAQRPGSINLSAGVPVVDDEIAAAVAAELEAVVRSEGTRLFALRPPARRSRAARAGDGRRGGRAAIRADPASVLVTTSGQQAIDLAVRALVEPGDAVLCETPTYAGAIDALVAARARIVPVPADAHGLQVEGVEEAVRTRAPTAAVLQPDRQQRHRHGALAGAPRAAGGDSRAESGLVVIEDDTGAELVHDGPVPPPIAACDPEAPVVLVKSYAKTVLPGLRLGVLLAPPALDRRVLATKLVADRYTSPPLVHALARYLSRPEAAEHLERVRLLYRGRRDAFLRAPRAAARRPRDLARAAGRLQPLAPPGRSRHGGGGVRARGRPRRHRLARPDLRPAGHPDVAPAAVLLHGDRRRGRPRACPAGHGTARRDGAGRTRPVDSRTTA